MLFSLRSAAVVLWMLVPAVSVLAQASSDDAQRQSAYSLPDWQIGGSSIETISPPSPSEAPPAQLPAAASSERAVDRSVEPASFAAGGDDAGANDAQPDERRLAPRGKDQAERTSRSGRVASPSQLISNFGLKFNSAYATMSALVFVLGLFFLCMWLVRRSGKKKSSVLPGEVVSVLGRMSLAPKQFAELLRVGNKLVLVSLTADGAKPLTEVTDPGEVDRLLGLCQKYDPHSASHAFEQVFRDLAREPAPGGFLGQEAPFAAALPDLPPFVRPRGGATRA
jgi:flagellar biogenesis protein FliO